MPKEYPAEFKTKIIKRYQKGESIQSLSQELHIALSGGKTTVAIPNKGICPTT